MSANPDPTGVFSKTEYDLAAAKGLNAPQPKPTDNPMCSITDPDGKMIWSGTTEDLKQAVKKLKRMADTKRKGRK